MSLPVRSVVLAALLAVAGCAEVRDLVGRAFERPTLTFQSASLDGLDFEGVTVALHYRVDNSNSVGLKLARLGYALDVEGRRVVSGELPAGLQIPARGSAPLVIPVRLRFRELPEAISLLVTRDQVAYRVSGHVGVDSPIGVIDLPFEHEGRVPLPKPPSFSIESARITSTSVARVGLTVRLKINNTNGFPLPVGSLKYAIAISGTPVASVEAQPLAGVPSKGSGFVDLPLSIDTFGAARAAALAISGEPIDFNLTGAAGYGSMRVPLDVKRRLAPGR